MEKSVLTEIRAGVATLTLNRPEVLNAVNAELAKDLFEAASSVETDSAVRCVVIRGAGGHFMAGGDLKAFSSEMPKEPEERRRFFELFVYQIHPAIQSIRRMPKPVVASVEGAAAGFGMSLMLACDLAIAAEDSFYTLAYCNIGTNPDGSSTYFLPRIVGLRKAMELSLLGERFDAATALSLSIVNRVVPTEELSAETEKLAARLAKGPTHAYANTKRLLNLSLQSSLDAQLQAEAVHFADCAATADFVEGISAFLEKRKPTFQGK